jgi:acetylornithine deacetylase/succinyl-diaminopimelate desuccinylase-like protein
MMGFGTPDENAHAPDENLVLENFHGGVVAAAHFYDEFARTSGRPPHPDRGGLRG